MMNMDVATEGDISAEQTQQDLKELNAKLIRQIDKGDAEGVEESFKQGARADWKDAHGTPLIIIATVRASTLPNEKTLKVLDSLIAHNAPLGATAESDSDALSLSIFFNGTETMKHLINAGVVITKKTIETAQAYCDKGSEIMKVLDGKMKKQVEMAQKLLQGINEVNHEDVTRAVEGGIELPAIREGLDAAKKRENEEGDASKKHACTEIVKILGDEIKKQEERRDRDLRASAEIKKQESQVDEGLKKTRRFGLFNKNKAVQKV